MTEERLKEIPNIINVDDIKNVIETNKMLLKENKDLQERIDKAIKYIEINILNNKIDKVNWEYDECYFSDMPAERIKPLIDILRGDSDE